MMDVDGRQVWEMDDSAPTGRGMSSIAGFSRSYHSRRPILQESGLWACHPIAPVYPWRRLRDFSESRFPDSMFPDTPEACRRMCCGVYGPGHGRIR